jgi:DNA-binding beta-propeller fold protein YncE
LQKPTLFKENAGEGDMITSLTYNRNLKELLFTTKRSDNRIKAINADADVRTFVSRDDEHFGQVAVDPLTKSVYFTENGYDIGVCDKKAKNCLTLIPASTHQQRFSNLIFNSRRGTMIWVQDDPTPVVKIAGMDGKDVSFII